jgi:uncharacterized membrane protein
MTTTVDTTELRKKIAALFLEVPQAVALGAHVTFAVAADEIDRLRQESAVLKEEIDSLRIQLKSAQDSCDFFRRTLDAERAERALGEPRR